MMDFVKQSRDIEVDVLFSNFENNEGKEKAETVSEEVQEEVKADKDEKAGSEKTKKKQEVKVACTRCKASHRACKGGFPCKRCKKYNLGHTCVPATRKRRGPTHKDLSNIPFTGILPFHFNSQENPFETPQVPPKEDIDDVYSYPVQYASQGFNNQRYQPYNLSYQGETSDLNTMLKHESQDIFFPSRPSTSSTASTYSKYSSYDNTTTSSAPPAHHYSLPNAGYLRPLSSIYGQTSGDPTDRLVPSSQLSIGQPPVKHNSLPANMSSPPLLGSAPMLKHHMSSLEEDDSNFCIDGKRLRAGSTPSLPSTRATNVLQHLDQTYNTHSSALSSGSSASLNPNLQ